MTCTKEDLSVTNVLASHKDARGEIYDILVAECVDAITLITFEQGAVRANHYHKETVQWNFVLDGSLEYYSQKNGGEVIREVLSKGRMSCSPPGVSHAFKAMEKSSLLVMTKGPRAGFDYEKDTFRLSEEDRLI